MTTHLTIKELTDAVGGAVSPRMVRHYHQLGLLPPAKRSPSNYRLYTDQDVQRLRRIVALKQQGFQLSHIQQFLDNELVEPAQSLTVQLQRQYQAVMQQLVQLRQTAAALEGILGRDRPCQSIQAEALAQIRLLEIETQTGLDATQKLWDHLDVAVTNHPENFQDSLQQLLPDLSDRSEIELDLLSQLVLACGDVSLVSFVRLSRDAIQTARTSLKAGCLVVGDVPAVVSALDQARLAHLSCSILTLINDPHLNTVADAEHQFWQKQGQGMQLPEGCIVVIGYAPSVLMKVCEAVEQHQFKPALIIGMPVGFSHAPAAKRRLMSSGVPFITLEGTLGGGLLAAVALNVLATSLIEKPDCHCHLSNFDPLSQGVFSPSPSFERT
jgi:precorrin-8X/cobalt-precorrin-8 methylmutase